jgi:hypothetical protein
MSSKSIDEHIDSILTMMLSGAWITGRSIRSYAQQHELPISTARNYSQIASRIAYSGNDEDKQELKASTLAKAQLVEVLARKEKDYKGSIAALRLISDVAGLHQPNRLELTINHPPAGLPLEVAEAWGKTDDLSRRKVHRHVLLDALASLDEWPYDERISALQDVRDLLTRLEGSIVAVAGGGER